MFDGKISDKATVNTGADDMESVSTFATQGNATWGTKSHSSNENDDKSKGNKKRGRRQDKVNPSKVGVIATACVIAFMGMVVAAAMFFIGVRAETQDRKDIFERGAFETVSKIRDSFDEYVNIASLTHGRMRYRPSFNASAFLEDPESYKEGYMSWSKEFRQDFNKVYQYVEASGLKFKALQFHPNITRNERSLAEEEARLYYAENYPDVEYTGFRGFNGDLLKIESRWDQPYYFPVHYLEPVLGNEDAIGLDYYSSESRTRAVGALFESQKPSLTDRLSVFEENDSMSRCNSGESYFSEDQGPSFGIVLMHPGVQLKDDKGTNWPKDISSIFLCMSDLLVRSTDHQNRQTSIYIHDLSHPIESDPVFMGGARIHEKETADDNKGYELKLLKEVRLDELECENNSCYQRKIDIANRKWKVTIINERGTDFKRWMYVGFISLVILTLFIFLAVRVVITDKKNRTYSQLKAQAAAERNALVLENANKAAQTERELNDFLAHEVRNPLSAAMAATQFLRNELDRKSTSKNNSGLHAHFQDSDDEDNVIPDEKFTDEGNGIDSSIRSFTSPRLGQAREDIRVVDHALRFINELLRNMLDMHRASSGKMLVKFAPVDLLRDVLEPVAGMLHRGGEGRIGRNGKGDEKVQIVVDCPEDIVVETDLLRLKQVILNLGRNSVKFINEGFIRLRAEVVDVDCSDDPSRLRDELCADLDLENGDSGPKSVRIYVEDSGSGIPEEKRGKLFAKYQESLDLLSQGTGIGLHLCKNLVELMGGKISLDNDYDSGIQGNPGARFVVDLQSAPLDTSIIHSSSMQGIPDGSARVNFSDEVNSQQVSKHGMDNGISLPDLPKDLNVLFIDDDRVLRKLFARTIRMVAPDWNIREAANGETAILLTQEEEFDIIFCDMYMASVEKQLLGTETVAELRSNGCKSRICGLSANDKEMEFIEAGADAFLFKPIPCDAKILRKTLHQVLNGED